MRGQKFVYDKIQSTTIRLLHLDDDSNLSGKLITKNVSEIAKDSYYALSYCWGTSRKSVPLLCNGKILLITPSLASGIRQIRELRNEEHGNRAGILSGKYFWIDQICINQSDKDERCTQVMLMSKIFSKAIRTIVWGGPDERKTLYSAFRLVRQIHAIVLRTWPTADYLDAKLFRKKFNVKEHKEYGLPELEDHSWVALKDLFSRQWFYRLWVVQEVVVSPRDPLLIFGDITYLWTGFASVARWLLYNGYFFKGLVPRSVACVVSIAKLRNRSSEEKFDFGVALRLTFDMFSASDPRDRAYGILSMCSETTWPLSFDANYNSSTVDVYRTLVRHFVTKKKSIISFTLPLYDNKSLSWRERRTIGSIVPSWFPNWKEGTWTGNVFNSLFYAESKAISHPPSWRDDFFMHHRAAGETTVQLDWPESGNTLYIQGLWIDAIKQRLDLNTFKKMQLQREQASGFVGMLRHFLNVDISSVFKNKRKNIQLTAYLLQNLFSGLRMHSVLKMLEIALYSGPEIEPLEVVRVVFMVTTTGDHLESQNSQDPTHQSFCDFCAYVHSIWRQPSRRVRPEDWNALEDIIKQHVQVGNRSRFEEVLLLRCAQRRFFITSEGYLGIGPATLKKDDVLCVLFGAGVPFLLRRKQSHYVLIGPCYVHGLMKGEAIGEENRGRFKEETFEIR